MINIIRFSNKYFIAFLGSCQIQHGSTSWTKSTAVFQAYPHRFVRIHSMDFQSPKLRYVFDQYHATTLLIAFPHKQIPLVLVIDN